MRAHPGYRTLETAVHELFDSGAEARVYLFLLRTSGARSETIIKGTKLHPSTVRECLSQMYDRRVVSRKKLRTDSIGKNPYLYYPVSPLILLQRRAKVLEGRLNTIASLTTGRDASTHQVRIRIQQEGRP